MFKPKNPAHQNSANCSGLLAGTTAQADQIMRNELNERATFTQLMSPSLSFFTFFKIPLLSPR